VGLATPCAWGLTRTPEQVDAWVVMLNFLWGAITGLGILYSLTRIAHYHDSGWCEWISPRFSSILFLHCSVPTFLNHCTLWLSVVKLMYYVKWLRDEALDILVLIPHNSLVLVPWFILVILQMEVIHNLVIVSVLRTVSVNSSGGWVAFSEFKIYLRNSAQKAEGWQ
jgi:hypothetical protein